MPNQPSLQDPELLNLFVVESVQGNDDLPRYLSGVLEHCTRWFGTSGASIFLATDQPGVYRLEAKVGPSVRTPDGATLTEGEGLAGQAIRENQPRIVLDSESSSRRDIGSSMIVPLMTPGAASCIGVLNLARGTGEAVFVQDDLRFAEAIAHQIALAVRNAKLFAESGHLTETLRAVLAHLGAGLVNLSPEGHISHANPEAVRLLGKVPGQGQDWGSYRAEIPDLFGSALDVAFSEARVGRRHQSRQVLGDKVFSISATPLASGGCTLTFEDVTEVENQAREFDRIKRLAEVGQITATIAHEIRNPLTGIRSAARMIKDSPELADEFADIIESEVVKLNRLCDEFLEFARPLRLEKAPTNLRMLVDGVAQLLRAEFTSAAVNLQVLTERDLQLDLDSRRVEQVLRNLMLNALQATPKGGTVSVEVTSTGVSVADTGSGMDGETLKRLFSPFFTTKPKGTGLGLSMVRKVVDAHGGVISVESQPGFGTRFDIAFVGGDLS